MATSPSRIAIWKSLATAAAAACLLLMYPKSKPAAQTTGLVAAYGFDEGTGTTVSDASGNKLTGTIVGATWTVGRYGNALRFNGSSNYVDLGNPTALQLTGSMTIEAWIDAAANPADDGQIVAKSNGIGWEFKTTPDTGKETFGLALSPTSTTHTQRYTTTVRNLNTWYHVAGVYDAVARTMTTYVNGTADNGVLNGTIPASQFNASVNANIGRRSGGFYFNGVIDEIRIYNRALSQTEIQTDLNTPINSSAPPDTTPPTISITAPLDGASVMGTTSLTVAASDNVGVASVQYLLDGANLGGAVLSAPFTLQWNTTTSSLGPHTLSAIATDFSGNTTLSTPITVTVSNPTPAQIGQWSAVMNWPIVAVHAALLPSGDVLAWTDYTIDGGAQLWQRATNTFVPETYDPVSLFCAGMCFLSNGRLLVSGGIVGLQDDLGPRDTTIFDSKTDTWAAGAFMNVGRYYPTTTTLGDGRVFVNGGTTTCVTCIADIPEIFDPVMNTWTALPTTARKSFQYYPHGYQLPDGRILVAAQDDRAIASTVLDLSTQTWSTVDSRVIDGHSSVMYLPGKILKSGTATADNPGLPSAATSYTLDMTQANPMWQATGSMAFPRSFHNLTVLPDGQVLVTGGGVTTDPADHSKAVYAAELWSPASRNWTTMSSAQIPRQYHSTALLLPDATVLVAGGGRQNGRSQPDPADEPNAEIFSPPYLFKGPRPTITAAPSLIPYNTTFTVSTPDASRIGSVAFIALSAVTHAFNENQRFVPATFQQSANALSVQSPANGNIAPPGPYMLFIVDTNGIPSVAAMVRLPAPTEDIQPPTAPANLVATASTGLVSLSWVASTDNVGVTAYNVYRSTSSGFAPSAANWIGQSSTTAYADTAFTAGGTYYYFVTAQDANANVSAPSNEASSTVTPDVTPPTVSVTAPVAGSTVSGITSVTASASDDVSVAGVQILLDGVPLGAELTGTGPTYTYPWVTTTTSNGTHTLSARARDGAGNSTTAAAVTVVVANAQAYGLVAAYGFNEGTGTTVSDASGNNLTGTIVGATWTVGRYGNALHFDGATNYVDLGNPAALDLTGSMTIEAWVNAAANPADDGQIVAKSNGIGWEFKTTPDTGKETFGLAVSPTSTTHTQRYTTTVRSLSTWYHVAGVYDAVAGTMTTYVNGVADNGVLNGTISNSQFDAPVNVNIGRRNGGFYFNGVIDEVRIYNRALSQTEIQTDLATPITSAPAITSIAPTSGPSTGGTSVTITGANFAGGATVGFGAVAATGVTVVSNSVISATTPAQSSGVVSVTVTNPNSQAATLTGGFTYLGPAPTITGVTPASGPAAGGFGVAISGSNFVAGATVSAGGSAATAVNVVNGGTITATAPSHAAGAANVIVTNPDGQSATLAGALTYVAPPTITSVAPTSGLAAGGTTLTITGTNFVAGANVSLGGVPATNVSVASATSITATTAAHASGAVAVAVTNPDTQTATLAGGFTYLGPAPTLSSVIPAVGPAAGGSAVTISGSNFVAGATVTVGGSAATAVSVVDSGTITATTPVHASGAANVVVTNPDGQNAMLVGGFTYVPPPTITAVAPPSGPSSGGTAVTITGANFVTGASVSVGGVTATNIAVASATSITATTAAHVPGVTAVTVTNPDAQTATLPGGFTYVGPAPTVTGVVPVSGSTSGGTLVTITGTNFVAGATVSMGGSAATAVSVVNSGTITATAPSHVAGAADLVVANPDGQSATLAGAFTYVAPPTITSVAPTSGPVAGGTTLTITGTNFLPGASVSLGGVPATNVAVASATSITATTASHAAGAVAVAVTNPDGQTATLTGGFTYLGPAPTITSVQPASGATSGGTSVTVTGTNFATGATVTIGGVAAANATVVNSTSITAITPAHTAGAVTVTVTNPDGQTAALANGFTYAAPPTITNVAPTSGPPAGGTTVTITGTNFLAGASVSIGGAQATNVTVVSATAITATTPAHAVGTVSITVTNPNSLSATLANGFSYSSTITFIQVAAATPQSSVTSVSAAYSASQTSGDLNVVVVGWDDTTSTIQKVSDARGNAYQLAIGPTTGTGRRQSVYYAPNIAAGSNTVTVTFSKSTAAADLRILQYRGVSTVDVAVGSSGSGTSATSGTATTTSTNALIVGADTVATLTKTAGSGFSSRIITSPDGDIAEDRIIAAAGSYSASATLTQAGPWVMQMVIFK